jgi:hypothetical protein
LHNECIAHLGQSPSDRARLLWSEIKREKFLVLVELPEVLALLLVHHSQDPCNRLAHNVAS